ncbi:MAG: PfkB family carbohydrate kinase [Thermodesulfobacteriota bacterium]
MVLVIGEILVDVFPEYQRIGGAPFNFAYHLQQFGIPVSFISRIGDDAPGRKIWTTLQNSGFDTDLIQVDPQKPTGRVNVVPDGRGGHRFDIEPEVAYDFIELPATPEALWPNQPPELIYFGTLAQRTQTAFSRFQNFLSGRSAKTEGFYDINLRPDCYTNEIIEKSLRQTDILKLNQDEMAFIQDIFNSKQPCEAFPAWVMETFAISLIALTKGDQGSDIYTPAGHFSAEIPPIDDMVDTVGAGDAYSAILAIGYLQRWPPARIVSTATDFAGRICHIQGAVPEDASFYTPFLKRMTGEENG